LGKEYPIIIKYIENISINKLTKKEEKKDVKKKEEEKKESEEVVEEKEGVNKRLEDYMRKQAIFEKMKPKSFYVTL